MRNEHDQRMTQAWTTAALQRTKKLPELKSLLSKRRERRQTIEEQRKALTAIFGHGGRKRKKPQ